MSPSKIFIVVIETRAVGIIKGQGYEKPMNTSHVNDKDCALFSRMCLELVTMQKCDVKKARRHKKMPM